MEPRVDFQQQVAGLAWQINRLQSGATKSEDIEKIVSSIVENKSFSEIVMINKMDEQLGRLKALVNRFGRITSDEKNALFNHLVSLANEISQLATGIISQKDAKDAVDALEAERPYHEVMNKFLSLLKSKPRSVQLILSQWAKIWSGQYGKEIADDSVVPFDSVSIMKLALFDCVQKLSQGDLKDIPEIFSKFQLDELIPLIAKMKDDFPGRLVLNDDKDIKEKNEKECRDKINSLVAQVAKSSLSRNDFDAISRTLSFNTSQSFLSPGKDATNAELIALALPDEDPMDHTPHPSPGHQSAMTALFLSYATRQPPDLEKMTDLWTAMRDPDLQRRMGEVVLAEGNVLVPAAEGDASAPALYMANRIRDEEGRDKALVGLFATYARKTPPDVTGMTLVSSVIRNPIVQLEAREKIAALIQDAERHDDALQRLFTDYQGIKPKPDVEGLTRVALAIRNPKVQSEYCLRAFREAMRRGRLDSAERLALVMGGHPLIELFNRSVDRMDFEAMKRIALARHEPFLTNDMCESTFQSLLNSRLVDEAERFALAIPNEEQRDRALSILCFYYSGQHPLPSGYVPSPDLDSMARVTLAIRHPKMKEELCRSALGVLMKSSRFDLIHYILERLAPTQRTPLIREIMEICKADRNYEAMVNLALARPTSKFCQFVARELLSVGRPAEATRIAGAITEDAIRNPLLEEIKKRAS